jgi:hypothetical protein
MFEACRLEMLTKRTIKAKVLELRKGKAELLLREYLNFQRYLHGDESVLSLFNVSCWCFSATLAC